MDFQAALAALIWQVELGADEALGDAPVIRYEAAVAVAAPVPVLPVAAGSGDDAVRAAQEVAARAGDLAALREALAGYDHCELKKGAKSLVFSDGVPGARVMIVGEAPGRDEDAQGKPFVGRAGLLLDRMFASIGLSRSDPDPARGLYITNVMVWRPPQDREPTAAEIAMLLPFLMRHIALAAPEVLVVMGNTPLWALLKAKGITRLRGQWSEVLGRPALPMFHPAYLLGTPQAKREAWADLLTLQARLRGPS